MQTKNRCEEYLNSSEVIRIVQSNNETFITKIFECISSSKAIICQGIVLEHPAIATDLLQLIRDDAFQQAQIILVEQIRLNRFAPVTESCIPFLRTTFRNEYYREYKKEIIRQKRLKSNQVPSTEEMKFNFATELTVKVNELLEQLNPADREVYLLRYKEDLKIGEIAPLLQIAATSVTKRLMRLHRSFQNLWQ